VVGAVKAIVLNMPTLTEEQQSELGRLFLLGMYGMNIAVNGVRVEFTEEENSGADQS
jgi:hypothetical protein